MRILYEWGASYDPNMFHEISWLRDDGSGQDTFEQKKWLPSWIVIFYEKDNIYISFSPILPRALADTQP